MIKRVSWISFKYRDFVSQQGLMCSLVVIFLLLQSCSQSNDSDVTTGNGKFNGNLGTKIDVTATINWQANRETAVNSVAGGYRVFYSKTTPVTIDNLFVDVPYDVNLGATPTSVQLAIQTTGVYYFAVLAYSALNPPNGSQSQLSVETRLTVQ